MKVRGVLETSVYVDDLEAAGRFYGEVLGLERHSSAQGRHVFFVCGQGMLLVFRAERTLVAESGVPAHGSTGPGHIAFAVRADETDAWRARLEAAGVGIEAEVSWPAGGRSIYFRDPAGNSLEIGSPVIWGLAGLEGEG